MFVINITPTDFGGRIRSGDILGACNMLEDIRIKENNNFIKFYLPDESVLDVGFTFKFRDFLKKYTDYFSDLPGTHYLNLNRFNMWDYRSNIPDRTKVNNSNFIKTDKICIFPLFDATYNFHRNWDDTLVNSLIDYYSTRFPAYKLIICSAISNKDRIESLQLKQAEISYDYEENLNHVMDCKYYIGGDTGITHLAGSLINPPTNIYYYSCRALIQSFPLNWKTTGDLKNYSEYGFTL
jgi:ADP-heptose:LPS heptosyltransferase